MGTFNTTEVIFADPRRIPSITNGVIETFRERGYTVSCEPLGMNGYDISISKGGLIKSILGLKAGLKVTLTGQGSNILFDAHVGILGRSIIPAAITLFVTWPVLVTTIWGLVKQAHLDDEVLEVARCYA